MNYEIVTIPLSSKQINLEFESLITHLISHGEKTCKILFGAAWGNWYYPSPNWKYIDISLKNVIEEVRKVERMNFGKIGENDLFLKIGSYEILFCNDSDIHIMFDLINDQISSTKERWKEIGILNQQQEN